MEKKYLVSRSLSQMERELGHLLGLEVEPIIERRSAFSNQNTLEEYKANFDKWDYFVKCEVGD